MSRRKRWFGNLVKGAMSACLVFSLITGCGSMSNLAADAGAEEPQYATKEAEGYTDTEMSEERSASTADTAAEEGAFTDTPKIDTSSMYNRKVIKEGKMSIQTKEFSKTVEDIMKALKKMDGYVESMDLDGNSAYYCSGEQMRLAELTVRIPQDCFDDFINNGNQFGNVSSVNCSTQDVTGEYVDAKTRIEVLKVRYDRLLELMSKVTKYEDIFKFEKEIADVEYEINSYQGKLNHFDSVVDLSTIHISVQEVKEIKEAPADPTFGQQLKKALSDSWKGVLGFLKGFLIVIVSLLPTLIVLVPVAFVIWFIIKKCRMKPKKSKDADNNEDDE